VLRVTAFAVKQLWLLCRLFVRPLDAIDELTDVCFTDYHAVQDHTNQGLPYRSRNVPVEGPRSIVRFHPGAQAQLVYNGLGFGIYTCCERSGVERGAGVPRVEWRDARDTAIVRASSFQYRAASKDGGTQTAPGTFLYVTI
jgi:hypothetical protein